MLRELRSFENLGTPSYFFELLSTLQDSEDSWVENNINELFYNRVIDGRSIFDGCLPLALQICILIKLGNFIEIDPGLKRFLYSEQQMTDKFVELLFLKCIEDDEFHIIFSSKNISYDVIYQSIQINNTAFAFKYAGFKQLLIDFNVIKPHPTLEISKFIINPRYKRLFYKVVLPEIKKRKVGIEELTNEFELKKFYGDEAERFVLAYEKRRLNEKEGIEWVAEYTDDDGYDILSFNTEYSLYNDRCIEVKSYSKHPYFFWSKSEMNIARIKGDEYYLYLVNRDDILKENYNPLIVQNPFQNVLKNSKWVKEVEKYRIELGE